MRCLIFAGSPFAVLVLAACGSSAPRSAPTTESTTVVVPPADAPSADPSDPIIGGPIRQDCRPEAVIARRLGGQAVIDCGDLNPGSTADARERARVCVATALAGKRPFRAVEYLQGIDSEVGFGVYATTRNGAFQPFTISYDSDPCGGGCPDRGHADITVCKHLVAKDPAQTPCHDRRNLIDCFDCAQAGAERCVAGDPALTP